jgi:phage recombination protein Bet
MSTAIATTANDVDKWADQEMINTLKDTVCKGATNAQFRMFAEVCKATGLSPWLREIWFVPGVGVMAGRDGYLRVANEHPMFDGMETKVERDAQSKPVKATCSVYRKDRSHPITCEAYYNEYKKSGNVWQTYPSAMISKVAEVLALKRSFSINGVVTEEEIGEQEPTRAEKVQAAKDVGAAKLATMQGEVHPVHDAQFVDEQPQMEAPPAKISFKALESFKDIKTELKKLGAEARYYGILKTFGAEKSNQLNEVNARDAYKALAVELKAIRLAAADREETDKLYASLVVTHGAEAVDALIGREGHAEWAEVPVSDRDELLGKLREHLA